MNSQEIINKIVSKLELLPHPEGGFYKESYRSNEVIEQSHLPNRFTGDRNFATAIYFLLSSGNFSAFHKIQQDEVWHFYEGAPLNVHVITPEGEYTKHKVGSLNQGLKPQLVVPKGCWFASNIDEEDSYTLVGCTVAPGFDFADFELAKKEELGRLYPKHIAIINQLTRN